MLVRHSEAAEALRTLSPSVSALLALRLDACRWPTNGPRWWCGKPAIFGSYCAEHHLESRLDFERSEGRPRTNNGQRRDDGASIVRAAAVPGQRGRDLRGMMYRLPNARKTIQDKRGDNSNFIVEAIKNNPGVPGRQLAQQLGISHGKVQRERRRLAGGLSSSCS
jgi:hypothetical protein